MKKYELEKMFLDPQLMSKLGERASSIKQRYGDAFEVGGMLRDTENITQEFKPTLEELRVNNDDHVAARGNALANMNLFLPELEKEEPRSVLKILADKARQKPSVANQLLVEDAVNRLTNGGELDSGTQELVDEAIQMLTTIEHEEKKGRKENCIWSRLYRHSNYNGRSFFVFHGPGWVYRLVRVSSLSAVDLNDRISSLYTAMSNHEVGGEVILFQHDRYIGRYARFLGTSGTTVWTSYVGNFINDRTSSILVVRRFENELPPIALGGFEIRDTIAEFVDSVSRVSLRGTPIITWDMWPEGPTSGSDPHPNDNRRFIYLRIPIEVDVPYWFDYDADIRYWIYPWVDNAGNLRAYVAYYGAWVEGGVKHNSILDRIMDELPGTIGTVNSELTGVLSIANTFGPFARQYFLPGTAANTGNTADDVSIVLVRK